MENKQHYYLNDKDQEKLNVYLAIIASLLSGFFLFLLEQFLFWPYIFEELIKVLIIFFFILKINKNFYRLIATFFVWLVFIFVENIFYLPQFIAQNDLLLFYERFLGPSILHFITFVLLLIFSWKYKHLIWLALGLNIFLHYFFNLGVLKFF